MLSNKNEFIQSVKKVISFFSLVVAALYANSAFAALGVPSLDQMLVNLNKSTDELMRLTTAVAYVMGMFFIVKGIGGLKHAGEARTHHSPHQGIKGPLIIIAVGAALLYLPSSVHVGMTTFWDTPNPYQYKTDIIVPWSDFFNACFMIFQLIGTISFIRGLVMLSQLGGHGGHQASFGKALTHMIAGIFLINMYQFLQVIKNTLGLGALN